MATMIRQVSDTGARPGFRVWHAQNPPHGMTLYAVADVGEAKTLIEKLIQEDLENEDIGAAAFGLEELEADGQYYEWYSEDGDSISDVVDKEA